MMKTHALRGFILLALFALTRDASSQTPDTTSAWRYYPLQVGNVWEYLGYGMQPGEERLEIARDTTIDGTQYFFRVDSDDIGGILAWPDPHTAIVRFDSASSYLVQRLQDGSEVVTWPSGCELNASFGGSAHCRSTLAPDAEGTTETVSGGYDQTVELADGSILSGVTTKVFGENFPSTFVADIGWTGYDNHVFETAGMRLSYARVGGVEYGTDALVAREPSTEIAAGFTMEVYPNPFVGTTTVSYSLSAPSRVRINVFDLLGRRVVRLEDGIQPAGRHEVTIDGSGLRSGVYVLLVVAGGARQTQTLVVTR